jgi:hypothetical protein
MKGKREKGMFCFGPVLSSSFSFQHLGLLLFVPRIAFLLFCIYQLCHPSLFFFVPYFFFFAFLSFLKEQVDVEICGNTIPNYVFCFFF